MNQDAAASVAEPLALKKWIFGAAASLRLRSSKSNETTESKQNADQIVCSREYLSCALKIAHSLADQLSAVEEERGYKEMIPSSSRHRNNTPSITEMIDKSWSGYISVYCTAGAIDETKDGMSKNTNDDVEGLLSSADDNFEPLSLSGDGGDNSEQPGDLQDLSQQLSTLLDHNFDHNYNQSINYMEVQGAILNEEAVVGRPLSADGKMEIRSLGIALYELFSGGQITAETGMSQQFSAELPTSSPLLSGPTDVERLSTEESEESMDTIGGPSKKRPQLITSLDNSSQKMMARTQSASISVEPLKLLGLPTALCDLISNMIESGGGNGKGHDHGEAYEFISEVRDDLKLMIDSPNVYLQDIDLGEAANVGLQFGNTLYGREAELQALNECYQRSILSACEVAMICGLSGVGKSKLCEEFIQSLHEGGSIVLSGRCDKLHSQPLHAISSVFDEYCASLSSKDRSTAEKIAATLKEKLGDDIASLVAAIPNLANIVGNNFNSKEVANDTVIDAQKRLHYLFSEFVGVISSCHDEPLILFLDDCQWIDSASVALLNQIMIRTGSHASGQGFFFGSYRDDEMSETHPLNLMLSSVDNLLGIKTSKIHLTPLSKGALNEMLSTTLSLLPRITRPLADILHHKTKGSPLFVKQVIMELYNQRLLYPSLPRRRWVWEADKILDMKIPENVANLIAKSFGRLPSEVLSALVVLSCFGASADISMMEVLEREIQQPLISPLDYAVDHSVLGKRNGELYFMHDKLQEAAYSMMKPEERCLHHNRYGLALGFVALRENNDRLLLSAVGQINQGGSQAVIDGDQAVVVANLNLDAGKKALNMSDFFAAHSLFNHGISYLRRGHWEEHYDLSLELFNLAMKCALINAEHESLKSLIDQVMQNTKCFEDRCQAISSSVTLLTWSGNVPEAIELINSTLASLGEGLPTYVITPNDVKPYLDSTKALLASLSDDALLNYPVMKNPSKILAVELLAQQFQILPFVGVMAEAMPIIPFKTITISLTYGLCPLSPVAFAQYGNFLALVGYEFEEGYRYVKLALSLMKKLPSRACSVMFHSNYTKLHVEPMQSVIEFYVDSYRASMKSGNPYAIGCSYVYDIFCFWSGKKLNVVVSSIEETIRESKHQKNFLLLTLMLPTFQLALRLMGQSSAPQQDRVKEVDNTGNNVLHLRQGCFVRLTEALMSRDLNEARDAIDKYSVIGESAHCHFNVLTTPMLFVKFYCGLVSFWVCREMMNDKKNSSMKWLEKGVECKDKIEKLATLASEWNFQNKAYLLRAEEQFCRMDFEAAERLYDAAILASKTHKFVNEEALASELAGHFYLETGRKNRSVHYFSQAFEKYNEWGAVAKANMLTKYLIG